MAAFTADNFTQLTFMGAYGNQSYAEARVAALLTYASADTIDLFKLPGGARVFSGFVVVATAVATATFAVGVRYADGTSTGGTTGTAVLSGTGVSLATGKQPQTLNFVPFTNDVDTIVYATLASPQGAVPGANTALSVVVTYEAAGTK